MKNNQVKILINVRDLAYKGGVANFYRILNIQIYANVEYFFISRKNTTAKFIYLLKKYISYFKIIRDFDIAQLNPSLTRTAIWRDLIFLIIARLKKKKVIVFIHGWNEKFEEKIRNSYLLTTIFLMYNTADAFFVSGSVFKHKLIRMGISKKKRFYIETMIADDRYINDFSIENKLNTLNCNNSPIIFLFMSRITKGKGMCLAIDIFNIIQNMNERKMELIMAGDGDKLRVTKNYVKENNIKNIVFTGYVKDMKKHELLKKSHITLFPTMYGEGIPNTILEGTLYGMPIISRINAGIPDWISNGINGFLTESTNPYDFVPFIEKLLISSELYENIAMNNHNLALNNFTKTVITKRFFHHYREVYGS